MTWTQMSSVDKLKNYNDDVALTINDWSLHYVSDN